jgi:SAM-dependent methyltransferase
VVESRKQGNDHSEYSGKSELLISENSLASYNQFIVKEFMRFSNLSRSETESLGRGFRTLDFGAGYGTLALIWRELTGQQVECLEIDEDQLVEIKSRGFIAWNSIAMIKNKFDFIYSSNVLEHIEKDESCLIDLAELLEQGGRIGIYVPAFMVLFSDLDRSVGHYRRYGRQELINKVERAGLTIVQCRYVDSIGFFASLVIKVIGYKSVGNIGSAHSIKLYDTMIFPISKILDRITFGRLLGKNLLLIAEKETKFSLN